MKSVALLAIGIFLSDLGVSVHAEEPTAEQYGIVLNLSGRQRMLTQKMSKETLLVSAKVNTEENRKALSKTMQLFETTLQGLRDGDENVNLPPTSNKRIVRQLDTVDTLYGELKPIFSTVANGSMASKEDLAILEQKNVPLLKAMNKAVKMYERASKKGTLTGNPETAIIINLAGKQRMLTQKMSKEFLLVYLDINTDENRLNVRETVSLFGRTLKGLLDGDTDLELPETEQPDIRAQLQVVDSLWKDFILVASMAADPDASLVEDDVKTLAEGNLPLLKNMNQAVKMYEKLTK